MLFSIILSGFCIGSMIGGIRWLKAGTYRICWKRKWQRTPVFLPGKSHGQRTLVGYSPWGHKESDTTERLHIHSFISSVQSFSCAQRFATPMGCSTLGFPVYHQLLDLVQIHVHQVDDAIQPSHPLSFPSPPAFSLSRHYESVLHSRWL